MKTGREKKYEILQQFKEYSFGAYKTVNNGQ